MKIYFPIRHSMAYILAGSILISSCNRGSNDSKSQSPNSGNSNVNPSSATNSTQKKVEDIIQKVSPSIDSFLGKGYNSLLSMNTQGACLGNVTAKFIPKLENTTTFDKIDSFESLYNSFNIGTSFFGGLSFLSIPLISANAGFNYLNSFQFNHYTSNMVMTVKRQVGTRQIDFAYKDVPYYTINPEYENISTNQFALLCGDSVIVEQKAESSIYVALKFSFANSDSKKSFDMGFGGKFSLPIPAGAIPTGVSVPLGFSAMFSNVDSKTKQNTTVTILARQVGGDDNKLPEALKNGQSCNLSNTEACSELFKTVNDYVSTNYPSQFSDKDIENLEKNPEKSKYILSTSQTTQYSLLPIRNKEKFVQQDIANKLNENIDIKNQIKNKISKQINDFYYMLNLKNSDSYKNALLASSEKSIIDENFTLIDNTFTKIGSIVNVCYDDINKCLNEINNIFTPNSMYKPIDDTVRKVLVDGKIVGRSIKTNTSSGTDAFLTPRELEKYDTIYIKVISQDGNVLNLKTDPNTKAEESYLAKVICGANGRSQTSGNITLYEKSLIKFKADDFVWAAGKSHNDFADSKICWVDSPALTKFTKPVAIEVWGLNTFGGI